jgi:hypothetical protein
MRRWLASLLLLGAPVLGAGATSDCGGKLDVDASISDATTLDAPVEDGPYTGQCCNIYDGSTAGPCDTDANEYGFGNLGDGDTYFCGHDNYSYNGTPGSDWRHCSYCLGHRWLCTVPADPSCCPRVAEPDDAGDPPAAPGACNGFEPADGF